MLCCVEGVVVDLLLGCERFHDMLKMLLFRSLLTVVGADLIGGIHWPIINSDSHTCCCVVVDLENLLVSLSTCEKCIDPVGIPTILKWISQVTKS